jgi:hypothetical protein
LSPLSAYAQEACWGSQALFHRPHCGALPGALMAQRSSWAPSSWLCTISNAAMSSWRPGSSRSLPDRHWSFPVPRWTSPPARRHSVRAPGSGRPARHGRHCVDPVRARRPADLQRHGAHAPVRTVALFCVSLPRADAVRVGRRSLPAHPRRDLTCACGGRGVGGAGPMMPDGVSSRWNDLAAQSNLLNTAGVLGAFLREFSRLRVQYQWLKVRSFGRFRAW